MEWRQRWVLMHQNTGLAGWRERLNSFAQRNDNTSFQLMSMLLYGNSSDLWTSEGIYSHQPPSSCVTPRWTLEVFLFPGSRHLPGPKVGAKH